MYDDEEIKIKIVLIIIASIVAIIYKNFIE